MNTLERVFALSSAVRYVALYRSGELVSRQRHDLAEASASESDKYEELLVNPTLLTLIWQRGNIDWAAGSSWWCAMEISTSL